MLEKHELLLLVIPAFGQLIFFILEAQQVLVATNWDVPVFDHPS